MDYILVSRLLLLFTTPDTTPTPTFDTRFDTRNHDTGVCRRFNMATKPSKPQKPRSDFPLFPHNNGKWAKKINGVMKYFGRWANPEGAEAEYLAFAELNSHDAISIPSGGTEEKRIPRQASSAKPSKPRPALRANNR
jgi:hypothetical protein